MYILYILGIFVFFFFNLMVVFTFIKLINPITLHYNIYYMYIISYFIIAVKLNLTIHFYTFCSYKILEKIKFIFDDNTG